MLRALLFFFSFAPAFADEVLFSPASPGYELLFPRDHGSHSSFQTEWWYLTGHLVEEERQIFEDPADFGFQLTFFRRGASEARAANWQNDFLAHGALSILKEKRFLFSKLTSSGGLGVAGAKEGSLQVWNKDWRAELEGDVLTMSYVVPHASGEAHVQLQGKILHPIVLHGDHGYSKKGECETCASHYYSVPGIQLRGTVAMGAKTVNVHGLGWLDHEFMSNALQSSQEGWDWLSIMLRDGRSLMLFRVRGKNGAGDFLSGTLTEGESVSLSPSAFSLVPGALATERSPSGARYPLAWSVKIPDYSIDLTVLASMGNQELSWGESGGISYWEGAARVSGSHDGIAYLEMTGYSKSIGGAF